MKAGASGSFGAQLKALREAAGSTQEELATIAGLSVHAVSALEIPPPVDPRRPRRRRQGSSGAGTRRRHGCRQLRARSSRTSRTRGARSSRPRSVDPGVCGRASPPSVYPPERAVIQASKTSVDLYSALFCAVWNIRALLMVRWMCGRLARASSSASQAL
jgi:hypothetical protein